MRHSSIKFEKCPICLKTYRKFSETNINTNDQYKCSREQIESVTEFYCGGILIFQSGTGDKYRLPEKDGAHWEQVCPKLTEVKLPE